MNAIVNVNYTEGEQDTYTGMEFTVHFRSGNVHQDYEELQEFARQLRKNGFLEYVLYASSVYHFVMDGDKIKFALKDGRSTLVGDVDRRASMKAAREEMAR